MIDHFLLTRFNVREPYADDIGHLGLNEGWLERRFDLFEKTCLPSVVDQTCKDFQWLIFLDESTPQKYVERMDRWSADYNFMIPVYCKDRGEEFVLGEMAKRACHNVRMMTRLDNDDILHAMMIERTRKIAENKLSSLDLDLGFFISFPFGYSVHEGSYYLQFFRCNPFVSFISDSSYPKTIFGWDHTKIVEEAPVVYNYRRPLWCQVIHGENVANTVRGVYLPWFKDSGFICSGLAATSRKFTDQCKEFWRTFKSYLLRR